MKLGRAIYLLEWEGCQVDLRQAGWEQVELASLPVELGPELGAAQTSGLQTHHQDLMDLGWLQAEWQ